MANILPKSAIDRSRPGDNSRFFGKVEVFGASAGDIAVVPVPAVEHLTHTSVVFYYGVAGATSISIDVTVDDLRDIDPSFNGKGSMSNANSAHVLWVPVVVASTSTGAVISTPFPASAFRVTFTGGTGGGKVTCALV